MPWILNLTYFLLVFAVSPVLIYRSFRYGKYWVGWGEKLFGKLPLRRSDAPCVWFHAVSVGEVLQLEPLLATLAAERPDVEIVVTTTTSTGHDVARRKFPSHTVCYFPLDFSWSVRRALERVHPSLIVLVELELWPNFILCARRAGIPLALINGRISARSHRGYRSIRPILRRILGCFDALAVQNDDYRRRLIDVGAPPERIEVTGSIKFDRVEIKRDNPRTRALREAFGLHQGERVLIAGSTHAPEEDHTIRTYIALSGQFPDLRLMLVPRHSERFDGVAELVTRLGLPLVRRSGRGWLGSERAQPPERSTGGSLRFNPATHQPRPVLLLDTLGELSACWGLADIAFVGGSLTQRGGQNMIEPAGYGAAVLFGPNTWNFRDVVEMLLVGKAATVVPSAEDLTAVVRQLLEHPDEARRLGAAAQKLVLAQQGATAKTCRIIANLLPSTRSATLRRTG